MKKYKNRTVAGIILGFLILMSVVPAMAEEPSISLNPMQPTTAGSYKQISWYYTGVFEPNITLELLKDGILDRTIISQIPLEGGYYWWAIPLSLEGLYQIKITARTTTGLEVTNVTDIEITTPTEQSCRYCHGIMATRHHYLVGAINPYTNQSFSCNDCHPVLNNTIVIERNCLNCHNGTAFWANPLRINPGEPHLDIPQLPPDTTPPIIDNVTLSNNTPNTGAIILVTVNATDDVLVTSVMANGISLIKQSNDVWKGSITAIEGTHSVNVSASDGADHVTWDNSTSYTAMTPPPPNIIVTSPMTGDNWVRGTTHTITWTYTGYLGSSATVELLEQGRVDQTWNNVPQSNGVGSYDWAIPSNFKVSTYQLRVSAGGYSNTTGNFRIVRK